MLEATKTNFVINFTRYGVEMTSEKTLADVTAENWRFYDPPKTFKMYSNS